VAGYNSFPNNTVTVASTPTATTFTYVLPLLSTLANSTGGSVSLDYTTTFSTTFQGKQVIALPDFARGPDNTTTTNTIKVPNDVGNGIPVTFYNASGLTSATFTVAYNPTLLTVTGGANLDSTGTGTKTFQMVGAANIIDATHATANFSYTNTVGQTGQIVLGDIIANVPNGARTSYGVKELLTVSSVQVNGSAFTGITAPGVHLNTYLGDVSGDGAIGAADVNPMFAVSTGTATGFGAYTMADPAVMGDVTGDGTVDGSDVAYLKAFILGLTRTKIAKPPTAVGTIVSPSAVDPTISLAGFQTNNGIVSVPVMLDHPRPDGSTGLTSAILALTYDPSVLSVSAADITLGSIPGLSSGWEVVPHIDATTGQIAIELFGTTALTSAQAGSLVTIGFHVVPGTTVASTAVQLADTVTPGNQYFSTNLADSQSGWILSPGVNRLAIPTGVIPATVTPPAAISDDMSSAAHGEVIEHTAHVSEEHVSSHSLLLGSEADDTFVVMSNGTVAGETVYGTPANVVVTGALAFQNNQVMAATQLIGQVFQIANLPMVNGLVQGNTADQFVDRLFLALARGTDAVASDFDAVTAAPGNFWDTVVQDWMVIPSQPAALQTQSDASAVESESIEQTGADRIAVVDQVFAGLVDETDDFSDLGGY